MKKILTILLLCMTFMHVNAANQANFNIVPLPNDIQETKGKPFILSQESNLWCNIITDDGLERDRRFLWQYIKEQTGISLKDNKGNKKSQIILGLNKKISNPEGYRITVNEKEILIEGSTAAGVF